jgi:membrane-anchored protein YejM (alkaline phosphatase superfamily)
MTHMHALSRRSSVFLQHFSSGNSTPHGIFGLFYGIHPTYWAEVKANSAAIDNPVLIDALKDQGYAFGIYADSQFGRHKIKDTTFRGIEVHEAFAGATVDARDGDLTAQLFEFMEARYG